MNAHEPEADYQESVRATELKLGNAVLVNFRGWGNLIMRVSEKDTVRDLDGEPYMVHVFLTANGEVEKTTYNADDSVVLFPPSKIGEWR